MFNKKEIGIIIAASIILGFVMSFVSPLNKYLITLSSVFIVILVNVFAKKIAGYFLDIETTIKLWETRPWEIKPWSIKFFRLILGKNRKKPFPMGAFIPLLIAILSSGTIKWLASLTFNVKPFVWKSSKRHGLYSFSEISESHIGLIAASGVLANLVFAIIGYLIGQGEFAKINVYYAFYNIIPLSELDGNKIFFGNLLIWVLLAIITIIGTFYALVL